MNRKELLVSTHESRVLVLELIDFEDMSQNSIKLKNSSKSVNSRVFALELVPYETICMLATRDLEPTINAHQEIHSRYMSA